MYKSYRGYFPLCRGDQADEQKSAGKQNHTSALGQCLLCDQNVSIHQDFYHWLRGDLICGDCRNQLHLLQTKRMLEGLCVEILYEYNDFLENLLFQYKEGGDVALRSLFFYAHIHYIEKHYRGYTLALMPSSEEKNKERGFCALTEMLNGIHLPKLSPFYKKENWKQSLLSYEQRQHIDRVIAFNQSEALKHKKLLLIDDVCTTGATLKSAYRLVQPYVKRCDALVLCANPLFLKQQPLQRQSVFKKNGHLRH